MKKYLLMAAAVLISISSCAKANGNAGNNNPANSAVAADEPNPASVIKTIDPSVRGKDIVAKLKETYAGKVVLIDFWATWCGPCRMAMREIDRIKPYLTKQGAVFVYVTGETSPEADWKAAIKTASGDHYRLTKDQWAELCESLDMPGIPAYMLLNKDGSEAYSNVTQGGYPGNEIIQNNIEVALSK